MNDVLVKICGITCVRELEKLVDIGVDFAGIVIFVESSKRNNTYENAVALVEYIRLCRAEGKKTPKLVAVTVSPDIKGVKMIQEAGFDILQVHGELECDVKENCELPIWRGINIQKEEEMEIEDILCDDKIKGVVLDGAISGSGESFCWEDYVNISTGNKLFILAGGLNEKNVASAIETMRPDVVDVSSGVEYNKESLKKGKSSEKIEAFVKNAKGL